MAHTLHVSPTEDLIEHDTSTDQADCICQPTMQFVELDRGDGWIIVHNSLDGRETNEKAP